MSVSSLVMVNDRQNTFARICGKSSHDTVQKTVVITRKIYYFDTKIKIRKIETYSIITDLLFECTFKFDKKMSVLHSAFPILIEALFLKASQNGSLYDGFSLVCILINQRYISLSLF